MKGEKNPRTGLRPMGGTEVQEPSVPWQDLIIGKTDPSPHLLKSETRKSPRHPTALDGDAVFGLDQAAGVVAGGYVMEMDVAGQPAEEGMPSPMSTGTRVMMRR